MWIKYNKQYFITLYFEVLSDFYMTFMPPVLKTISRYVHTHSFTVCLSALFTISADFICQHPLQNGKLIENMHVISPQSDQNNIHDLPSHYF